jgi:hypothetical protein
LVEAAWNLRRLLAKLCSNLSYQELLDKEIQKKLDRLARHKTIIERAFHPSLKQLKALQTNAVSQATLPAACAKFFNRSATQLKFQNEPNNSAKAVPSSYSKRGHPFPGRKRTGVPPLPPHKAG